MELTRLIQVCVASAAARYSDRKSTGPGRL